MRRTLLPGILLFVIALAVFAAAPSATVDDARKFMDHVESTLDKLNVIDNRAQWVKSTYITADTEFLAAKADEDAIRQTVEFIHQSEPFATLPLPPDLARKFKLLKLSLTVAAPSDPAKAAELTQITAGMEGTYGKGKYCPPGGSKCLDLEDLSRILRTSQNAEELKQAWLGWHAIAPPIRKPFQRYVELANEGARELGFADTGAMWRAKYDMTPDQFATETDRLWNQVRPLYLALHAYVRTRLHQKYGDAQPATGPLRADLLGDMWAQEWDNIYPLVAPVDADPGYDLTKILEARKTEPKQMAGYAERFFTSLGFAPLPPTFWERSQFSRPRDRDVVCHASAWDVDGKDDLRVKVCLQITGEDLSTIHHELGHNFYQRAYNNQPVLFRDGANDGFHEAIGDTIALSVTPEYLVKIGLLDAAPPPSKDTALLLRKALEKIAFLPFGLLIDRWRWEVFNGRITPEQYNKAWWALRLKYQGIMPPEGRSESDFDAAAKYHVAANVPYTRYFLADILQFQFHRALAKTAGCTGPLNRCSIYDSKEAGSRLNAMLEMGQSKPWPDALYALTGEREMDATAILDYFAPLKKWLDQQNAGQPVGW
jgi:peptidyl-dipeptidase A